MSEQVKDFRAALAAAIVADTEWVPELGAGTVVKARGEQALKDTD